MSRIQGSSYMSQYLGPARGLRVVGTMLTIGGLVVGLSACGSDSETVSARPEVTSSSGQPATTSATSSSVPSSTVPAAAPTSTSQELPQSTDAAVVPAPVEDTSTVAAVPMPYVVCMNLQDAQDLIQEMGVLYSRSTDATGKDRNQVLDANWVVVGQNPSAGVPISEGDAVLSVVKIGETNAC